MLSAEWDIRRRINPDNIFSDPNDQTFHRCLRKFNRLDIHLDLIIHMITYLEHLETNLVEHIWMLYFVCSGNLNGLYFMLNVLILFFICYYTLQ